MELLSGLVRAFTIAVGKPRSEKADQTRLRFGGWQHDIRPSSRQALPLQTCVGSQRKIRNELSLPPSPSVCPGSSLETTRLFIRDVPQRGPNCKKQMLHYSTSCGANAGSVIWDKKKHYAG